MEDETAGDENDSRWINSKRVLQRLMKWFDILYHGALRQSNRSVKR